MYNIKLKLGKNVTFQHDKLLTIYKNKNFKQLHLFIVLFDYNWLSNNNGIL